LEWYSARRDDFGDIYEGLLEKNAVESKSGAGQYFTPRPLIDCIIELVKPQPGEVIQDPAAGTGGFLVSADNYVRTQSSGSRAVYEGAEIVKDTHRLCLMNLFVHEIEAKIINGDTLSDDYQLLVPADVIVTNPPFGARGAGASPRRSDLPYVTSNKQLLFLQHIYRGLKTDGRAGVILPDNVLFEGNAAERVRSQLMRECDLHTILRLPGGIFYSAGVKTNVLFFTRRPTADDNSREIWIFGRRNQLTTEFFTDFKKCFGEDPYGRTRPNRRAGAGNRWRRFSRDELAARGDNLDVIWLGDEGGNSNTVTADIEELSAEAAASLRTALEEVEALTSILAALPRDAGRPRG
jgi:type I restriction enzyme M protein